MLFLRIFAIASLLSETVEFATNIYFWDRSNKDNDYNC